MFTLQEKISQSITTDLLLGVVAIDFNFKSYVIDFTNLGAVKVEVEVPLLYIMLHLSPNGFILLIISLNFYESNINLLTVEEDCSIFCH